jgi:hypothetical protein
LLKKVNFLVPTNLSVAGRLIVTERIDGTGSLNIITNDSVGITTNKDIKSNGSIKASGDIWDGTGSLNQVRQITTNLDSYAKGMQ